MADSQCIFGGVGGEGPMCAVVPAVGVRAEGLWRSDVYRGA